MTQFLQLPRNWSHTGASSLDSKGKTTMLDSNTRLLQAEHALHHLELEIEQYRIHLDELVQHPHEAERARAVLEKMLSDLAAQRRYCELLAKADGAEDPVAKSGSSRVA
jgi:hypothetical protein